MIAALVAAALVVSPTVPARGDSNVPLVHVTGWYRLGPAAVYGTGMFFAAPESEVAFTLPGDSFVDSYFGGTCRVDGQPLLASTRLHHVTCRGSGA